MTHPNQSFIDGFFRNNKPQGNNSYYYSKEFIEEQRKKKFNQFLKESTGLSKKQSSKHIDAVLNLFGYNTLSNNKNKQEYITEAKLTAKQLPQQFIYNGLLYTFSEQLNSFVNQHGHVIGIEQATAFMQMMLLEEVEVSEMDSATDGGAQTAPIIIPEINFFSFDEPRPEIGPKQPNWFRNSAFNLSTGIGAELYRNIVGGNLHNTSEIISETPVYNLNGSLVSEYTISYSGSNSYLRKTGATENERVLSAYNEFVNPFGSTGSVSTLKKYDPDLAGLDVNFNGPILWRSKVVPLNGTTTSAYSVILKRYPNLNWVEDLLDAHHAQNIKCWAYLKPLFNYLNLTDYPPAKTITNVNTAYISNKLARSIFNLNYKNYLKDVMVELVTPKSNGGVGFDGIYWDYSFVSDEVIDFGPDAIDVWAKSLGYSGRLDPQYIDWAFNQNNFPFPDPSLPIYSISQLQLSNLINNALFTDVQKQNLLNYSNALINEYNSILQEYTEAMSEASENNAIFLPSIERNAWFTREEISVNVVTSKYSNGIKTELNIEPLGYHRQRERNDFYPSVLGGTSGSEKLYADVNRPDASSLLNFDQKIEYGGGNKTLLSWREPTIPLKPTFSANGSNNTEQYNSFYRNYPSGWLFNINLPGEDGIVGFLRGAYQICLKNSVIMEAVGFNNDGWQGDKWISGTGNTAYYIQPVTSGKSLAFTRKAAYHQKKIKSEMQNSGMTFDKRDQYAWAGIHLSNRGRQGIQSQVEYLGDFAGANTFVKQSQMKDPFGINTNYSNGMITSRKNEFNQNWGEFYWPIVGSMETLENYFVPYCIIHDEHLENITEINGIDVLIIPHRELLTSQQQTNIDLFVSLGGKVVYLEDIFYNPSYFDSDPRLKGRFYDLTDKKSEMTKLYNGITAIAGLPPLRGIVTKYEFEGMSFPFSNKYQNKQCGWSKYSEPDQNGIFTIGAHLLNDMVWMDHRRFNQVYDESRFSEIEPSSAPFRSGATANPSATGINGIMDYDLFGWGPDWRESWWNTIGITAYNLFYTTSGLSWPIPLPDGTTNDGDKRYFYEPHPRNMWGNPIVGGYTGGSSGYWNAQLQLNLGTGYQILDAKKIYVDQENEPNDLGHTDTLGFTYDSINSMWKVNVNDIGMHAFVALKVKKLTV